MEKANIHPDERRQFKTEFFKDVFFCKAKYEGKGAQPFKQAFPTAHKVLTEMKRRDYKTPSLALQRAESDIIINRAVRRLMNENPDIPILTVHDSIMTQLRHADTVKQVMLDAFSTVGLSPTIQITRA